MPHTPPEHHPRPLRSEECYGGDSAVLAPLSPPLRLGSRSHQHLFGGKAVLNKSNNICAIADQFTIILNSLSGYVSLSSHKILNKTLFFKVLSSMHQCSRSATPSQLTYFLQTWLKRALGVTVPWALPLVISWTKFSRDWVRGPGSPGTMSIIG